MIKQTNDAAGKSGGGIDRNAITIEGSDELEVLSPSTGIFYITASPTEPEFVAVGDRIKVSDTLCQLEAMKIFTPLALKELAVDNTTVPLVITADARTPHEYVIRAMDAAAQLGFTHLSLTTQLPPEAP